MQERLRDAIAAFYQNEGRLPVGVVMHQSVLASEVDEARLAVKALELDHLAVEGNGGPLVGEVWLALPNGKKQALQQAELFGKETRP